MADNLYAREARGNRRRSPRPIWQRGHGNPTSAPTRSLVAPGAGTGYPAKLLWDKSRTRTVMAQGVHTRARSDGNLSFFPGETGTWKE